MMPGGSGIGWHPPRPVDGEPQWQQLIYGTPLVFTRGRRVYSQRGPNKGRPEEMTTALNLAETRSYLHGLITRNVQ